MKDAMSRDEETDRLAAIRVLASSLGDGNISCDCGYLTSKSFFPTSVSTSAKRGGGVLDNEFAPPESSAGSKLKLLLRNEGA